MLVTCAKCMLIGAAGPIGTVHATVLGWTGWVAPFVFVAILLASRSFRSGRFDVSVDDRGLQPANSVSPGL